MKYKFIGRLSYFLLLPVWRVFVRYRPPRAYVQIEYKDKILLVQNWLGSGKWSYPGGGLHKGEDPKVGACREVREELGLELEPGDIEFVMDGRTNYVLGHKKYIIFRVTLKDRPNITLDSELNGYVWVKRSEFGDYKISSDIVATVAASARG